jgi:hypothetical protein
VIDLGNNKIREIPIAFVFFLGSLTALYLLNNELNSMPAWIGFHKTLSTIQLDGNPMKQIRMAVLQKGAGPILAYLRDKFVPGKDDVVEEWAMN